MTKKIILFLALLSGTAHAADRLACQTAGIITKCPADAQLAAGSVLQSAFVPWSAAPVGSIPNSALVSPPAALSSSTPLAIGTASAGTGLTASRYDHVHALPSVGTAGVYVYPISLTTDAQGRVTGITAGSAPQAASDDLTALSSFGTGLGIPVRTSTSPTWSISTTLSGITISCASNTCSNIANAALVNSSVTITAGTGLAGGGVVALGGTVTIYLPSTGPGAGAIAYPSSVTLDAQGRVTAATAGSAPAALASTTPADIGVAAVGVGATAARADHVHALPNTGTAGTYAYPVSVTTDAAGRVTSATAGSAPAALSGTTPASDSVSAGAVGIGTTAARADHVHLIPTGTTSSTVTVGNDARICPVSTGAGDTFYGTGSACAILAAGATHRLMHSNGAGPTTWGQVDITTEVTGVLPVANGGTNSSTVLNSNRATVTSGGKIVETASTCPSGTMLGGGSPPDCTAAGSLSTSLTTPQVTSSGSNLTLNATTGFLTQLAVNGTAVVAVSSTGVTSARALNMTGQKISNVGTATTSGDTLVWPWITATNGSASLSSSPYNIASGSYTSIGLALSLPSAGTYFLAADLRTLINASLKTGGFIECRLYNTTDAAEVSNTERIGAYEPVVNQQYYGQISINEIITIASAKTIDVQCLRTGATTYTTSGVYSDTNGRSRFSYIKVSP